ncbi:MAG: DUF951 domain-containing protein [Chloroflexi bacterium]|nr:DUF951 domain-containing protein [Chloroflexota bacterium]
MAVVEFRLGETLTLRKTHPCGGNTWRVERLGADIGIRCLTCSHYLLTSRPKLERAVKEKQAPAKAGEG